MHILHLLFTVAAILIADYLLPGATSTVMGAVVLAVVLGIINVFFRPILRLLTLPLNIVTLGLFSFVLNALLILLAAKIVPGFAIGGFWTALFFSVIVSLVSTLFAKGLGKRSV